jgi:peroxin-14
MATVSCGVAYGVYEVARRYVLPLIVPPTPSSLEADKEALEAEFARTEALVEQMQKDTQEIKESEAKRREEFSKMIQDAYETIEHLKNQSEQRESDMKLIKSHVESVKESLPKALERNRSLQDQALKDLQNELRSLKQLVQNRVNRGVPSVPPASSVPSSIPTAPSVPSTVSGSQPRPAASITTSQPASSPAASGPAASGPAASVSVPPAPATTSNSSGGAGTSPSPRPGIPAWQLAAANKAKEETASN